MLSCRYVGSSYAGKPLRKKAAKGFFDLWSRNHAQELTIEILQALGFSREVETARSSSDDSDIELRVFNLLDSPVFLREDSIPFNLIQARSLIQKNDDFKSGIDKEEVAWQSFQLSERQCHETNRRIASDAFRRHPIHSAVLFYAQRFIARVLGEAPSIDDLDLRFGPGAATSCQQKTTARWKLSSTLTVSNSLFRLSDQIRATMPGWIGSRDLTPSTGALEFVPKNFKTYRSIIIEPLVNTMVQKGIGTYMKQRMLQAGINLYDQSENRRRARLGSIGADYVTIDLERASDTLAYALVLDLLPFDWLELLDAARSGIITYKGKAIVLNKFSSMGNGFTFELESLIFRALAHGINQVHALDDNTTVFGDDIVASRATGVLIERYFPDYGFSINPEKSFLDGPFREACGGDYVFGVDVRPFFLKGTRTGGRWTYATCVSFHNFLQRKPWFDPDRKIRNLLLSKLPDKYHVWGPDGYGDAYLVSFAPLSSYLAPYGREKGFEGFIAYGYVARPCRDCTDAFGDAYLPAYLAGTGPSEDVFTIRSPKGERMVDRAVRMYVIS